MDLFKTFYKNLKNNYIFFGIAISFILLLFSFFAPILFTSTAILDRFDFSKTGDIGDTIGIMNPFIAIIATISTFMAFYIQYKANQEVQKQFKMQQFESQFYEMLRLHKENVNEISVSEEKTIGIGTTVPKQILINYNGRKAFEEFDKELVEIYNKISKIYGGNDFDSDKFLNKAYHIFFFGINSQQNNLDENSQKDMQIKKELLNTKIRKITDSFDAKSTSLAHLYRHLYLTVKFVVGQDEEFINYEQKRKYLRILRAQLSNPEQALLFYNWKAGFGIQWENDKNKFFTDYRMIHNLYQEIIIDDFDLEEIFKDKNNLKLEKNRLKDPLFEFEDWR